MTPDEFPTDPEGCKEREEYMNTREYPASLSGEVFYRWRNVENVLPCLWRNLNNHD